MRTKRMQLKFEGQTHQIDANTLINVLIHYQTVIAESNKELGGGAKTINLRVNAIEKGSFVVDISLVESINQIFAGDTMSYLANLCGVVGGVYSLYERLKGRPAKKRNDSEINKKEAEYEDNSPLIINGDNNNVTITNTIIKVYNQPIVREAISKSIETADVDVNVEGMTVDCGDNAPVVVFEKKNFKEYIYDSFDEENIIPDETDEIVDALLTIIALNFEPGSRWQFMYNGFKIQMTVKDDALMRKIDEGERFGKGDAIRVKLKIVKIYNAVYKAYENKSFKIVEFIEHILAPKQDKLF